MGYTSSPHGQLHKRTECDMPRSGEVGEKIFDQVERIVGEGLSRTDAFKRISEESGRREGTVAANYYRVARKRAGGSLRPRGGRSRAAAGTRSRRRSGAEGADIDALAGAVVQSVQELA